MDAKEALHRRSYFYVGGEYIQASGGQVLDNQMYVEKLSPLKITKFNPIVFIHGGGQTGTNWLNKPDGGKGWASYFLDNGYEVYIVDQVHTGRSAYQPDSEFDQTTGSVEYIEQHFIAVKDHPVWPQAVLHSQWPGRGKKGDPVFDTFYASQSQFLIDREEQERTMRLAGIAFLEKLNQPCILITHSRGGLHGWTWADARPQFIKALIQIEPRGPPFREAVFSTAFVRKWGLTSTPLTFSPSPLIHPSDEEALPKPEMLKASNESQVDCYIQQTPARHLVNLKEVPILVVTGEASYHAMYDHATVAFLEQAGCRKLEHLYLADVEIHGNGHMMFMEKNSDEIARVLEDWMKKV